MSTPNKINDNQELQASANKESLNKNKEESIVKGEARASMKELMAELDNPFALSQEQGQQFAKNDSVLSDAVGGESIDSSHNLATINADISNTKAKIDAIESKPNFGENDKDFDEVDALNKKLNELKVLQRTELIKSKQDNREEVIKNKQETREEAIKEIDEKIATQERILKKIDTIRGLTGSK